MKYLINIENKNTISQNLLSIISKSIFRSQIDSVFCSFYSIFSQLFIKLNTQIISPAVKFQVCYTQKSLLSPITGIISFQNLYTVQQVGQIDLFACSFPIINFSFDGINCLFSKGHLEDNNCFFRYVKKLKIDMVIKNWKNMRDFMEIENELKSIRDELYGKYTKID